MTDKPIFRGYTEPQLRAAFEKVENKEHWKLPNKVWVLRKDYVLTDAAVAFFTGSELKIIYTQMNSYSADADEMLVEFAGYYATIGA